MLPYFQFTSFSIGPIPIQVWGLCVALGILVGLLIAGRVAERRGLSKTTMYDIGFWVILGSMVGARLIYVLGDLGYYVANPAALFAVWEGGMSVIGGFAGAVLVGVIYMRLRKLSLWGYIGAGVFGLPCGLGIGRIGCFLICDHPGTPTNFFLGQEFSDGVVRHNNGLYLSLNGFLMAAVFWYLWHKNPERDWRTYPALFLVWYGLVRFPLDFLRATDLTVVDPRFFGLTIAQYASLGMIVAGCILWYSMKRNPRID